MRGSARTHRWLVRLGVIGIVLVVFVGIAATALYPRLLRLYRVMHLFEGDEIAANFRRMDRILGARQVRCGETPYRFARSPRALPRTFAYKGEALDLVSFLAEMGTTGMLVVADDRIAFEQYWLGNSATARNISWSVAKSILSALFGIAVGEGAIKDLMAPVTEYVPALKGTGYDGVPIKHVLQMSSGVRFNEDYGDFHSDINRMGRMIAFNTSIDDFVATLTSERRSGTYNQYVSMDTQVLAMVLRAATGVTLSQYTERKLWRMIGTEANASWLVDINGNELAFGGFNAVLRDYARFGLLYLNEGKWQGTQVVPASWVRDSVTPDAEHLQPGENPRSNSVLGYGYQWWIPPAPEGDFLAIGIYGQYIYVNPKLRVVIVKNSAYAAYTRDGRERHLQTIAMFRTIAQEVSSASNVSGASSALPSW